MTYTKQQIAQVCQQFGSQVAPLSDGIDGAQFLWAISGNESSFGANCTPRHEPAFDVGGIYGNGSTMKPLLDAFGSAAACSYGPWQVMFCNLPQGINPEQCGDLQTIAQGTVAFLNSKLREFKPTSLSQIGEIWNGGHPMQTPSAGVAAYVNQLQQNYAVQIPAAQGQ